MTLTCYKFGVNVYLQSTCKILIYLTLHCHLELLKALETCMKNPTPKPYMLKMVYDIKSWISDYCEELHEHTVPKCFKFTLNEDGKAVIHYRNWSLELEYKSVFTSQRRMKWKEKALIIVPQGNLSQQLHC